MGENMHRIMNLVRVLGAWTILFAVCSSAYAQSSLPDYPYVEGEVLVKFAPGLKSAEAASMLKDAGALQVKEFRRIGFGLIKLNDMSVEEAIDRFKNDPRVEIVEPNYIYSSSDTPNDPSFDYLWGLHNTGQTGGTADADIDAPLAWDLTTGSETVIIAVIDSGVDYLHQDLAANMWVNPGEIPGNGLDDDGNGYVDDVHGMDAVNHDADPMDDAGHGTHCAGTIGAVGNNGIGVAGVNWNVRIMALKFLSSSGSGTTDGAIECIEYATAMGAHITNNSWGGGAYSAALEAAIWDANNAGIMFVAAAGNSGRDNDSIPNYPSNYEVPNVISVGATDPTDSQVVDYWSSNYGATTVDVGAPGDNILSTIPDDSYAYYSGTSMATPHVTGALGLVKAAYPNITVTGMKDLVISSADAKPQLQGLWVSNGRLNVASMMAGQDSIPPSPVTDLAPLEYASNWISLTWTAPGGDGATGTADFYDIRYSTTPIDAGSFDLATQVSNSPAPSAPGTPEVFRVEGLDFSTMYHFALKTGDSIGNMSPLSNVIGETTLGVPSISVTPTGFTPSLLAGQPISDTLELTNTGQGVLDFSLKAVPVNPVARAVQQAALEVAAGLEPMGTVATDDGEVIGWTPEQRELAQKELAEYEQRVAALDATSTMPLIGVSGFYSFDLMGKMLANAELTGQFVFRLVDFRNQDLSDLDGLVIAEYDQYLTQESSTVLWDFYNSSRPIFLGMDDLANVWGGNVPGYLGEIFGITLPEDANLCNLPALNGAHPITAGIPSFNLDNWCADNDGFVLDTADWLFRDGITGAYHGVANQGLARSVLMGENLANVWDDNEQLNVNALIWMMGGRGLPRFQPGSGSVAAGATFPVTVTFDAEQLCSGVYQSEIQVSSNDPVSPEQIVSVSMTVTGLADIQLDRTIADFGSVYLSAVSTDSILVGNSGCETLNVISLATGHPDFSVSPASPFSLAPGEFQTLLVMFEPGTLGTHSTQLSLTSDDFDEPVVTVQLAGEVAPAPAITIAQPSLGAALLSGETRTEILTISNSGAADLVVNLHTALPDSSPTPGGLSVLLLGNGDFSEIQAQLQLFPDLSVVDIYYTTSGLPTIDQLEQYDAALLINDDPFADPIGLGGLLADYVDQGGGVIETFGFSSLGQIYPPLGRWVDEGYAALDRGPVFNWGAPSDLGAFDTTHPIMANVTSVSGAVLGECTLAQGADWVANWWISDLKFVATQGNRVVGINIFLARPGYTEGDLPLVVHNAISWAVRGVGWLGLDPREAVIPPGGQADIAVTFGATGLCDPGYQAEIIVSSDDPLTPEVSIPVNLSVTGVPDIRVRATTLDWGDVVLGGGYVDTLIVGNPGCDPLTVDSVTSDNPLFDPLQTLFTVSPGTSFKLPVRYTPTDLGSAAGVLSLGSNDPDEPLVQIGLAGNALSAPVAGISVTSLGVNLVAGDLHDEWITVSNTGIADLTWQATAAPADSTQKPRIGVSGDRTWEVAALLLNTPELTALFVFEEIDYTVDDLSHLDGLILSEANNSLDENKARIIKNFNESGRGIVMGMNDMHETWYYPLPNLMTPVFGILRPEFGQFFLPPELNRDHPITRNIPGFNLVSPGMGNIDSYVLAGADWLIREEGDAYMVAHENVGRTVLVGDMLTNLWVANSSLNVNAVIWVMNMAGLPDINPTSGVVAPGGSQAVKVSFDASDLCGGLYESEILFTTNDPLTSDPVVPVALTVTGEPDIALSDSLVIWQDVYSGGTYADTLVVWNHGCDLLDVTAVLVDNPAFSLDTTPFQLQAGESRALMVQFIPDALGPFAATISLSSNDPDELQVDIVLSADVLPAPVASVSPGQLDVQMFAETIHTEILTLTNTGGSDLVWDTGVMAADSLAVLLRRAGARAVADFPYNADLSRESGATWAAMSTPPQLQDRLDAYAAAVAPVTALGTVPVIGVGGSAGPFLMTKMLSNPELAGLYVLQQLNSLADDLTTIDGLVVAEFDGDLTEDEAHVLWNFHASGRPVFLGMDDLDDNWTGDVPALLSPLFGIASALDGDMCVQPELNTSHPVTQGIPGANLGGTWCDENDSYQLDGAEWLIREATTGAFHGLTHDGLARAVLMGENLASVWDANVQLNVNAINWMMRREGMPQVDPVSGVLPPGGTQNVTVNYDSQGLCGSGHWAEIIFFNNDPLSGELKVPSSLTVIGNPAIALSDTLVDLGTVLLAQVGVDTLQVSNEGCAVLGVTSVSVDNPLFIVDQTPFDLEPGASRMLAVAATPSQIGQVTGVLTLVSDDPLNPSIAVGLRVQGLANPVISITPAVLTADLETAQQQSFMLTLENNGVGELVFNVNALKIVGVPNLVLAGNHPSPAGEEGTKDEIATSGKLSLTGTQVSGDQSERGAFSAPAPNAESLINKSAAKAVVDSSGPMLDVLLLGSGDMSAITIDLLASADIATVSIFETRYATPTLGDLLPYHAVIIASNYIPQDPVATGDVVADYIDQGGGVIESLPSFVDNWLLEGRYRTGGYSPFEVGTNPSQTANLGSFQAAHPIMAGVTTAWGKLLVETTLAPGSIWVADWDNGLPCLAARNAQVIGFNGLVAGFGTYTGDVGLMLSNAAVLVGGTIPWLDFGTVYGSVPEGGSQQVQVTLSSGSLPLGEYLADIIVTSNDPANPVVTVPATLTVVDSGASITPGFPEGLNLRNIPSPFNPSTECRFNLPREADAEVRIFDVRGALVRRISAGVLPAGPATIGWAGHNETGAQAASGVYFSRLYLDGTQEGKTLKISLVK